jgi:thioredoxin reductase (NADPH)
MAALTSAGRSLLPPAHATASSECPKRPASREQAFTTRPRRLEARTCKDQEVVVVGGGNSAGQAAMFLASRASCVRLVHRGRDLSDSMSQYLIERLRHAANVSIETGSQVIELSGDERLRGVVIRDAQRDVAERSVGGLFIMIGADPCTAWVKEAVRLDDRGFILTGEDCGADVAAPFNVF